MAKFPVQMLMQRRGIETGMRKKFLFWGFVFLHTGFLLLLPLVRVLPVNVLFVSGALVLIHAGLYFLFIFLKKGRSIPAEILGISILSTAGIFGFFSSGGNGLRTGLLIWAISVLYYSASIFKVRALLFNQQRDYYRTISIIYPIFCVTIIFVLAMLNLTGWGVILCVVPLVENVLVQFRNEKVDIRRVGWIEVAKSAVFGIILILTLR